MFDAINKFESILKNGEDSALLRYSLGNEYLKINNLEEAIIHLRKSTELDNNYSAAWKLYAKALAENQLKDESIQAYETGIIIAEKKGDKQAVKEMQVFLKRLKNN